MFVSYGTLSGTISGVFVSYGALSGTMFVSYEALSGTISDCGVTSGALSGTNASTTGVLCAWVGWGAVCNEGYI